MRLLRRGRAHAWMAILGAASLSLTWLLYQPPAMAGPAGPTGRGIREAATSASGAALWVDAVNGADQNDGLTPSTALRTIQRAADLAQPGTTVHILPGIYRESVRPARSGSATAPIIYLAEEGPGSVILRGSEPAASLSWTPLGENTIGLPEGVDPTQIYYADLSDWAPQSAPRFLLQLDEQGNVIARLPLAREPDWQVATEWKYHQFWWAADGGSEAAGCDPPRDPDPKNCDRPWRSTTQLTDRTDDADPPGIEAGNLTTLGDLTGATLVAIDTKQGHYVYRRKIVAHDVAAGRITVDRAAEHNYGSGDPGLGWGTKYYVEGMASLLDQPGEWWFDPSTQRLYLWNPQPGSPAELNLEISLRQVGFNLKNRSYIILDGLVIEFFNGSAIEQRNSPSEASHGNVVRNATLRYANRGLRIIQTVRADGSPGNVTDGFTLERSEIAYMDTHGLYMSGWWEDSAAAAAFSRAPVLNTVIRDNEFHHLGFRTDWDNAVGLVFQFPNRIRFENNYVHHVAHNGVQFARSVIQSSKSFGFSPQEIKTGDILVENNLFEKTCLLTTDCGGLKFWGTPPDGHVFRNVLVRGNRFQEVRGWTWISEMRGRWSGGSGSSVQGMGGFGLYVDNASGLHIYRNIAQHNAQAGFMFAGAWRDGEIALHNNLAVGSLYGVAFSGINYDTHGSWNTRVANNMLVNNEGYGLLITDSDGDFGNLLIDYNLYWENGWGAGLWQPGAMAVYRGAEPNQYYRTLEAIQQGTGWERHGLEGDPLFTAYSYPRGLEPDASPDFHLRPGSPAIDAGSPLTKTLAAGQGTRLDVGEAGFFHDGLGAQQGDLIRVGANAPVRVVDVDHASNTLTLERSIVWQAGDPVSHDFAGAGPDIGVYERDDTSPPSTFADVPPSHPYHPYIEALAQGGYVKGCSQDPPLYCPDRALNRAESAVFIVRGTHGADFMPPQPTERVFDDVALAAWYADWVTQLWQDGSTAGCSAEPPLYCPERPNTRAEGAVFFLRMLYGSEYTPPSAAGYFADVDPLAWYAPWVDAAWEAGIAEPCATDPELRYCPEDPLTRAVAAYMMARAKGLVEPSGAP